MMQHTAEFLDVSRFLADEVQPERAFPLRTGEEWLVRKTQFDFQNPNNGEQDWVLVNKGDLVRIPILPYRSASQELPQLLAGAMDLQRRYDEHTLGVERTHLIIGMPVQDLQPEVQAFRFWVGFAARTR